MLLVCLALWGERGVHAQAPPAAYLQTPTPRQLAWHQLEYYAFHPLRSQHVHERGVGLEPEHARMCSIRRASTPINGPSRSPTRG